MAVRPALIRNFRSMRFHSAVLLLFMLSVVTQLGAQPDRIITRIAFGSCSHQDDSVQMWKDVLQQNPDLWIWLGDNIYGDTQDMALMEGMYDLQKQHPDYQKLLKSCPVIGTWDDHDYGTNDGGKFFAKRKESRELALAFLDVPASASVRKREGLYQAFEYGSGNKKVKVIMLDTRYFRDTLQAGSGVQRYVPNEQGDVLGETQWKWLRHELATSDARLHIIGSSIQFIAEEQGFEKWANFPKARKRMLDLLTELKPSNTIFITGDRHIAEVSKMTLPGLPYPLYDFTSSGLTHTWEESEPEANPYRVGELIIQKNFGIININWNDHLPLLELQVRGLENSLYLSIPVRLEK